MKFAAPIFPEIAIQARVQGTTWNAARFSRSGRFVSATTCRGIPLLNESCQGAIARWRFPRAEAERTFRVWCRFEIGDADAGKLAVLPTGVIEIHATQTGQ
jgi:hypothetical protein